MDLQLEKTWAYRAEKPSPEEISGFDTSISGEGLLPGFVLDLSQMLRADEP